MKLPFEFGPKLIFRLVFPGVVLAAATTPLVNELLDIAAMPVKFEYLFPIETIAWGWLVVVCDMHIYMLFEGRRYWPEAIRGFFMHRERVRLQKLRAVPVPSAVRDSRESPQPAGWVRPAPIQKGGGP